VRENIKEEFVESAMCYDLYYKGSISILKMNLFGLKLNGVYPPIILSNYVLIKITIF
jgi:hypothetical protein